MLRLAPNLQVAQITATSFAITARGFNGSAASKLLVLIDGRSVYTPYHSGVSWDVQDVLPEDIERIEVISGPGATLWGANAVNGVINVITRKSSGTQGRLGGLWAVATSSKGRASSTAARWGMSSPTALMSTPSTMITMSPQLVRTPGTTGITHKVDFASIGRRQEISSRCRVTSIKGPKMSWLPLRRRSRAETCWRAGTTYCRTGRRFRCRPTTTTWPSRSQPRPATTSTVTTWKSSTVSRGELGSTLSGAAMYASSRTTFRSPWFCHAIGVLLRHSGAP